MRLTSNAERVREVVTWLKRHGSASAREQMLDRYGIVAPKSFGVSVGALKQYSKTIGRDHELAASLWATGWYEARMLTAWIDDPTLVTSAQMDRWARDFDNWAICDHLCFHLFDRTAHAWRKAGAWSKRREEFVRRAAFALLAGLSLHDKQSDDEPFLRSFALIETAATDDRNFVKKGVSWALRVMGRRSKTLNTAAVDLSQRLVQSSNAAARSLGKEALRELTSLLVRRQLAARRPQ